MILHEFTASELLQLYAECEKVGMIARLGIVPDDEILVRVDVEVLGSQLGAFQNIILSILNNRAALDRELEDKIRMRQLQRKERDGVQ